MKKSFLTSTALAVLGAAGLASAANAAVIKPDLAAASSEFSAAFRAGLTIDGSGLSSPTDVTAAHADYDFGNHWTTANGTDPLTQFIQWSFAAPQTIGAFYVWNHRSNNIASNSGYEPTRFDLTFFDASDTVLLALGNVALAPDTAFAQRIDFNLLTGVSRARFDINAVQSSPNFTGLAEVAFDTRSFVATAAVPEPATWAMLITGFGFAGWRLRRKSRSSVMRPALAAG